MMGHLDGAAGGVAHVARGLIAITRGVLALALPVAMVAGLVFVRTGAINAGAARVTGPIVPVPPDASAQTRLAAAATAVETAMGKGGGGLTFEIVQTQTMRARPGGPQIEIPDPTDRTKTLGYTDTLPVGTLIERGFASPAGFWSELIHGPVPGSEASFDLAKAEPARQALVRDGTWYRNDGDGWQATDGLPCIGLDPATIAKLPSLLRDTADAADAPVTAETDPAFALPGLQGPSQPATRAIDASSKVANAPAIVAGDLAQATELIKPTDFGLDAAGRLVALTILARNTNMDVYDLVVKTLVGLGTRPAKVSRRLLGQNRSRSCSQSAAALSEAESTTTAIPTTPASTMARIVDGVRQATSARPESGSPHDRVAT
jgi:hypothetical protein